MRAVWVRRFGPPEVLAIGDAPDPEPGPGQLAVRAEVAGISFVETRLRAGWAPRPGAGPTLPYIPGNAVGGVVTALGVGAAPALLGARVVSSTGGTGGYAERAAVAESDLVPVPDGLDVPQALALLADGRTALGVHAVAQPAGGEWVLVEAAGGGVGSLLVQLAHRAGARVVAAASSARKLALAAQLGAEVTVDYTDPQWTGTVGEATEGHGVDVVFDSVGGPIGAAALDLLATGGRFVQFGLASGQPTDTSVPLVAERGLRVYGFQVLGDLAARATQLSGEALAEAAAGRLRPFVGQTFPLELAAQAHAAIESRTVLGKTLLTM